MNSNNEPILRFTEAAIKKLKNLISDEKNEKNENIKVRIYISGGGCSGFQYGFTFDYHIKEDDISIEDHGVTLIVDSMSLQYLVGSSIDHVEGLEGSRFVVANPNAKNTCGCGSSFSI